MRGKDNRPRYPGTCPGITPAHAGKSAYYTDVLQLRRDHPRVCGEKALKSWLMSGLMGSPPHVRGKACGVPLLCQHLGITPACAGKSRSFFVALSAALDHPRVCGEKFWALVRAVMALGSPPRMRGKERCGSGYRAPAGITPACAGKSSIQHLTASLGEFEAQKGHPVPHLRQRLQVWPDHARHLRHGLILHASLSAGQDRRLCPGPCPDTAGSGTPRGPSPAKRPHTSPPAATPGGCRAWQSGATAPGSR